MNVKLLLVALLIVGCTEVVVEENTQPIEVDESADESVEVEETQESVGEAEEVEPQEEIEEVEEIEEESEEALEEIEPVEEVKEEPQFISDRIAEGETNTYKFDGVEIKITAVKASNGKARFSIKGHLTPNLEETDTYTFPDGDRIQLLYVTDSNQAKFYYVDR